MAAQTELVERVESALKVTDDVYLARVYSAALEIAIVLLIVAEIAMGLLGVH